MAKHYTPRGILRLVPTELWRPFFDTFPKPIDVDWAAVEDDVEHLYQAWLAWTPCERERCESQWRQFHELGTPIGLRMLVEEVLIEGLDAMPTEAGVFVAVNAHTGQVRWKSRALGRCSFVHDGSTILAVEESGQVTLAALGSDDLEVTWQTRPLAGRNWVGPAVCGSVFVVRDRKKVIAYDLAR